MKFIDIVKITVQSGNGGDGVIRFRKEKYCPKGGPYGGNGGKGGNVILKTDPHLNTLLDFKYKRSYIAKNGNAGEISNKTGSDAQDLIIKIPCGTLVKNADNERIIVDLTEPNQEYIIAKGGDGGRGNSEFATPTNQAPRYAEPGFPGEEKDIILELKLIADIGIVGLPNVGKSTLISVISAAKPKIADYHFTTLIPNLGIVKIGERQSLTVADIPGLIEGASDGKGLGIQFLRHVERTKLLVFLIDAFSENPQNDYKILKNELNKYNPAMKKKKRIICFSKVDGCDDAQRKLLAKVKFREKETPILFLSSVTGESVPELKRLMWDMNEQKD